MSHVTHIEECDDGFMLRWDNPDKFGEGGYVHLNAEWVEDFDTHQFQLYGIQNPALNQLRYGFQIGDLPMVDAADLFEQAYTAARDNASIQRAKRNQPSTPLQEFIRSGRAKNR